METKLKNPKNKRAA